ncbi:ankyrin repeat domain-containing protein (plasmid) [Deinococcus taeanensis]|uniref:ankyrin repeat domain-containing protein n=1 Tax=Deinococcus taeanensis TaxID=2737050 RepID=UPI001CDD60DC|nr:ankyrin repeat domain-containing protein [Deinococcus taeanensis]UBV44190.1 ankyrin repeat domain-containing protein [Deinococcus taeanensis]
MTGQVVAGWAMTLILGVTGLPVGAQGADLQELAGRMFRDASGGSLSELKTWLAQGADINDQLPGGGQTALMGAASNGQYGVAQFLIDRGADLTLKDDAGRTALDRARLFGDRRMAALLEAAAARQGPATAGTPPLKTPLPKPAAPAAAPKPAVPAAAGARPWTDKTRWPAAGHFRVGEAVQFWTPTGWRRGVVQEVRLQDRKSLIAQHDQPTWRDDYPWGEVAHVARSGYWTGFFVGDWRLGEVMAVNTRVAGTDVDRESSSAAASEALRVNADGTSLWKAGGKVTTGRWTPAADGPGVVVRDAAGTAWTLRNHTNAAEQSIRGLETARLYAAGKMSVAANRPVKR